MMKKKGTKMEHAITVCNQKGGTGKTTTVMAFSYALASKGKRTLAIDLDQQASLTRGFGFYNEKEPDIYDWIIEKTDAIVNVANNIDLLPATQKGVDALLKVMQNDTVAPSNYLKEEISRVSDQYDYLIIDTPPTLGLLLTNALVASDQVLIPIEPNYFSLSGFVEMSKTIEKVRRVNPHLEVSGAFVNNYAQNANIYKEYADLIVKAGESLNAPIFDTKIRRSAKIAEKQSEHTGFFTSLSKNPAAQDFLVLVEEYLAKENK